MFSFKSIAFIAGVLALAEGSAVPVAYTHAVPQNIPPYASQVSVVNRAIAAPLVAGPVAAPLAAAFPRAFPAPFAAPYSTPFAAPYIAGPSPILPAPYAAVSPYIAPGFIRTPFGFAPTFVR